jgi:uncharacterized protein YkwD
MGSRLGHEATNRSPAGRRWLTTSDPWVVLAGIGLTALIVVSMCYIGGANPPTPAADQPGGNTTAGNSPELNTTLAERAITEAVNEERQSRGLEPTEHDDHLAGVARTHSRDMIDREYYAHESPDGETPFDRVADSSASCEAVGENIAATWWYRPFETANGEVDRHTSIEELARGSAEQWLSSPAHRENMLDPRWEQTGVGVAVTDDGEVLVTQNFCE